MLGKRSSILKLWVNLETWNVHLLIPAPPPVLLYPPPPPPPLPPSRILLFEEKKKEKERPKGHPPKRALADLPWGNYTIIGSTVYSSDLQFVFWPTVCVLAYSLYNIFLPYCIYYIFARCLSTPSKYVWRIQVRYWYLSYMRIVCVPAQACECVCVRDCLTLYQPMMHICVMGSP